VDDVAIDIGQAEVAARMAIRQSLVIQSQAVQQRRVQVVHVYDSESKSACRRLCNPSHPAAGQIARRLERKAVSGMEGKISHHKHKSAWHPFPALFGGRAACQSDSGAVVTVIEDLQQQGVLPQEMVADTADGGDDNHVRCAAAGVDLISPTSGKCPSDQIAPDGRTAVEFQVELRERTDEYGRVELVPTCVACPA